MENCRNNNFGRPACIDDIADITTFLPCVPKNQLFDLDALNYNALIAKFTASDIEDRILGMPQMQEVKLPIADSLIKEASNQRKQFIREGKRSFEGDMWGTDATPAMKAKLRSLRCCGDVGGFFPTSKNQLIGVRKLVNTVSGAVYKFTAIKFDGQSFDPKLMLAEATEPNMIRVLFDLDRNFDDGELWVIDCDNLWDATNEVMTQLDLANLPVIIDCQLTENSATTTTTIELAINDDFRNGTRIAGVDDVGNVTGLVLADFLVENVTDSTTITPSSVAETSTGVYLITFVAQTSADVIRVSLVLDSTKDINYAGTTTTIVP